MKFTLLHPFFNHNNTLITQLEYWDQWTPLQKKNVEILIIDDCSPDPIDLSLFTPHIDLRLSVYRVIDDIPWNNPGVKNLGFTVAKADWVIATDMDTICTKTTLERIWDLDYTNTKNQYWPRVRGYHYVNSFIMSKQAFWSTGGFDEDFAGNYAHEDVWFHRFWCTKVCTDKIIRHRLPNVRFARLKGEEHSSKHPRDRTHNAALYEEKKQSRTRSDKILRFKWEKIL